MWSAKKSVNFSIFVCLFLLLLLIVLILFAPQIFELYLTAYRGFNAGGEALKSIKQTFLYCFYPSSVFGGIILISLLKLMFNIKDEKIFIRENVKLLKAVSWSCFAIAIITFIGAFFYMPFIYVSAAGGFTGMLLRVLKNVMFAAVEISDENELTI